MLTHPPLEKLKALKCIGMLEALSEQLQMPDIQELSFEERLGLLVDREMTERENRRLQTCLRQARLRQSACIEDIDYTAIPEDWIRRSWPAWPLASGWLSISMS